MTWMQCGSFVVWSGLAFRPVDSSVSTEELVRDQAGLVKCSRFLNDAEFS